MQSTSEVTRKAKGFLSRILTRAGASNQLTAAEQSDALTDGLTISMLLGTGKRSARNRMQIYLKWIEMVGDPIISTALRLHVTAALGGHETSGDVVFIETAANAKGDKQKEKIAAEIGKDLAPIFNRIAYTVAFNGAAFGDSYGRVYTDGKNGVCDVYVDELVHPSMVTSYERGNQTVGFVVASGARSTEQLTLFQMARMKMPRMVYIPQVRAMEKAIRMALNEDNIHALPLLPSLIGGSFLDAAEQPYDQLSAALVGLVGQRVLDSLDESMMTVNQDGMTKEQRLTFMTNIKNVLKASKARAEQAIKSGKPVLERVYNIIPVTGEKQLTAINGSLTNGGGRGPSGSLSIEDVLFHAKLLSGALGIDLSMLGFSELLSGGLGDGGFFRTSAQAAERSRLIRVGLTDFYNHIINIHTHMKYGVVFADDERPWHVNFYGTISSLETERQKTKTEAMNTGLLLVQALQQLRDLGLDDKALAEILIKVMLLDEDQARLIVRGMPKQDAGDDGGDGDGGFGGNPPPRKPRAPSPDEGGE
ncbi:hypothetical protein [Burkholderia ubonensis]|uniref:Portal protein n=1 Tax=Burkholderia ubonensis TaxID=101571 RepID=A0ABD4DZG9_9BURK|nr:hypothetical protein [Burkholderia ubonensis]KVN83504.1 hypothetical protein WJ68_16465 [Burkholderia ubonensis]